MTTDISVHSVRHLWIAIPVYNKEGTLVRHRKARKIKGPFRPTDVSRGNPSRITIPVSKRAVKGTLILNYNQVTDQMRADSDALTVYHKLAKRKYIVVGYDLQANRTNLGRMVS